MVRILLAGVPGVGKSSALAELAPHMAVPVVNFGSAMLDEARARGYAGDRDGLRRLSAHDAAALRAATAVALPGECVIDGHLVVRTPAGMTGAVPEELLTPGYLRGVILLEGNPHEIRHRRVARDRPGSAESASSIAEHLQAARAEATRLEAECGLPTVSIDTEGRTPDQVARLVADALPPSFLRRGFK